MIISDDDLRENEINNYIIYQDTGHDNVIKLLNGLPVRYRTD